MSSPSDLFSGLPLDPLPPCGLARRTEDAPHAPVRQHGLDGEGKKVYLLAFFPSFPSF